MKIEKLYTLSQYVTHMALSSCTVKQQWDYTEKYNTFLEQPIKKEMFVNPHENENGKVYRSEEAMKAWLEAEKKVIFKGNQFEGMTNHEFAYPKTKLPFRDTSMEDFETLGELAEYYEGELETINLEI